MASSSTKKTSLIKKKRKISNTQFIENPPKLSRKFNNEIYKDETFVIDGDKIHENMEFKVENNGDFQWKNLNLVLNIHDKKLNPHMKIEIIFDFISSRGDKGYDDLEEFNTLSFSRLIGYISTWIQSLLITAEKKYRAGDKDHEDSRFFLDYRCWEILRFCLKEAKRLHIPLSLSRDLLRVISCLARFALHSFKLTFSSVEFQVFNTVNESLKLLFSSHGRLLNENLDLWALAVTSLLELVISVYTADNQDSGVQNLVTEFPCLVFESFSKFLRLHPCRKNGFRDFVDKLLEPLLHLLGLLHAQNWDKSPVLVPNLLKLVEETLSNGLFHSVHLDEYCSLHITDKYSSSADQKLQSSRMTIKSYHRHLFDKLDNLVSKRKFQALSGVGELFRLFIVCVKKLKRDSQDAESLRNIETGDTKHLSKMSNIASEKSQTTKTSGSEMRKSFFDFFVLTMEPLLLNLSKTLQHDHQPETYILKTVNEILSSMVCEGAYSRIEDNSGGACLNFFSISYGLLMSSYAKFNQLLLSSWSTDGFVQVDILNSMGKEFILLVENFLEIDYEVIGDDLVSIWLMILTCLPLVTSSEDASQPCLLVARTVDLGCRVVNLYSELRQVDRAIFALCKGLRYLSVCQGDGVIKAFEGSKSNSSHHCDKYATSARLLLCSQKFRLTICDVIKSIPEGQAVDFVQTLCADIVDCLEWMKVQHELGDAHSYNFNAKAEIFGIVFSEIYTLVLDSLSVSAGYSYRMGESIEELIGVLRPCMSHLSTLGQDGPNGFLLSVLGITQNKNVEFQNTFLDKITLLLLFFFRVYVSCRSLYRQALSLMPPDPSKKMSEVMGDFYTAFSGEDCMERTKFNDEGYFFWVKCSVSLPSILQFIKDNISQEGLTNNCCLIYVMHIMALQRLVDLSRQIHCVEYILRRREVERSSKLIDDDDQSISRKGKRKQEKLMNFLSALKQEASCLAGFIVEYLSIVDGKQQPFSIPSERAANSPAFQDMVFDSWDGGACTVNEKTLPTAIWWVICQNIDIWCNYTTKKKLKNFLSVLILNSLPESKSGKFQEQSDTYTVVTKKLTKYQISQQILHDTNFYDLRFVRRHMASRVCHTLKKCISKSYSDVTNIVAELDSSDWTNALGVLRNSVVRAENMAVTSYCAHSDQVNECSDKGTSFTSTNMHLAACRSLLDVLCMMSEISLSTKSLARSVIYLLNFERLLICCLLDSTGPLFLREHQEILGLLVSCRRSLKYLLMTFCVEKSELCNFTKVPILSEVSSSIVWLWESVKSVITWSNCLSLRYKDKQVNDMIVSLVDLTSYVFVNLCKRQFGSVIHSIVTMKGAPEVGLDCEGNQSNETEVYLQVSYDVDACKSITMIVEALEEETKSFLLSLKKDFSSGDVEVGVRPEDLKKLSSVVSCIQGFLWGLEHALNDVFLSGDGLNVKLMKDKLGIMTSINDFMDTFIELIGISFRIFLHNDNNVLGINTSQKMSSNCKNQAELGIQNGNLESETITLRACGLQNACDSSLRKKKTRLDNSKLASNVLTQFSSFDYSSLKIDLLSSFLYDQSMDAAFFLRALLIASSAVVRLSLLIDCSPLPLNLIQYFLGCSEVLLKKFSEMDCPSQSCFVWLDGPVKFFEAMGSVFTSASPIAAGNVYSKLVEVHLKAIGKCISLQGKGAMVASHIESSAKMYAEKQGSESNVTGPQYDLYNLKERLRMSFKSLIEKPSEPMLLSVLEALERALVGLREDFTMICDVKKESTAGGTVSSMVAGAIDCLDSLLEFYKGKRQLNALRLHINSLLASLYNIVAHLQGPALFYMKPNGIAVDKDPDSGSVVLMCVEVLTRIAGKRAQFHLYSHHVGQSLHIPTSLFQGFCFIKAGKGYHTSSKTLDGKEYEELESCFLVDRKFSVNLYAASCQLLWTVVKHRNSECVRYIALLQNSLQALLHCLEIVSTDSEDRKAYFSWVVEEGVKSASYLRRVYEEIGQQKDVFGQHCFMFLSDYIWVYSGNGPLKRGIKREVDEALRPGIYALLDVCSADDLQYLHTVFGEGPCRSTLASLKDDHKRQQYEGKV